MVQTAASKTDQHSWVKAAQHAQALPAVATPAVTTLVEGQLVQQSRIKPMPCPSVAASHV